MKKQIIYLAIIIALGTSCEKTEETQNKDLKSNSYTTGFKFAFIDKDSNALFKYPDILNSKYNPKNIIVTSEDGTSISDRLVFGYSPYRTNSSFNVDSLKNGDLFYGSFGTEPIEEKDLKSSKEKKYYIKYNDNTVDTIVYYPYLLRNSTSDYWFNFNGKPLPFNYYKGSKYYFFQDVILLIK